MRFNALFNVFTKNERKRLTLRTDGPVDYYTENDPYERKEFVARIILRTLACCAPRVMRIPIS